MARTTRRLVPVKKDEPFQPPAPGGTTNARAQMALDALGPSVESPSLAAATRVEITEDRYTTKERRAASHAMDFNGTSMSALSFVAGTGFPGFPTLALLAQLPEYRAMHEVFADEAIRTWGKPIASGDCAPAMLSQINDEIERLRVRDVVRELVVHDQAFGRAHAAICIKGDQTVRDTPLIARPYTVRKGSFEGIKAVEPYWVTPNLYNSIDPWRDDFYKPSSWWMIGQEVHSTRLRCLISRPVPDMLKPAYSFAGISSSQLAMPYVDNWLRTRQSVSDTVKQFSIVGVALDMAQALAPGANQDLINRAELINRFRDNRNILFLDKTQEEFFMFNVPLGGLDALQAQAQEQMAAVSHIPLIKLLGITPTGLNASSEGEIRVFYDFVRAYQRNFAQQLMNEVCSFVQLSLFGAVTPGITWQWHPLHELNALELAEKQKSLMDTHTGYAAAGIVRPDQVAKVLDNDPDSPYAGVLNTDALEEPEDTDIAGITEYVEALTEQAENSLVQETQPAAAPGVSNDPQITGALDAKDEPHAAGAVYLADDKVLLLQRPDGTWGLPGGRIEDGETSERAARRELQEETGYRHRGNLQRVGLYEGMFHAFTGKTKQFPVTINDEHIGHGWFPVNALPEPLHRTTGVIVNHARKVHEHA